VNYAKARQAALQVFLSDPEVPIHTNHLERGLRPIPMGKKNYLFAWTEIGAERIGLIQSLLVTCRLHGVDPYTPTWSMPCNASVNTRQAKCSISRHASGKPNKSTPFWWTVFLGP
jgi:hypothetical protein